MPRSGQPSVTGASAPGEATAGSGVAVERRVHEKYVLPLPGRPGIGIEQAAKPAGGCGDLRGVGEGFPGEDGQQRLRCPDQGGVAGADAGAGQCLQGRGEPAAGIGVAPGAGVRQPGAGGATGGGGFGGPSYSAASSPGAICRPRAAARGAGDLRWHRRDGAVRGRLRGGARLRIGCGGWLGHGVLLGAGADPPQRRRRPPGLRRAAGRDAAAGDGNARGR
jgi:hypothetical protein